MGSGLGLGWVDLEEVVVEEDVDEVDDVVDVEDVVDDDDEDEMDAVEIDASFFPPKIGFALTFHMSDPLLATVLLRLKGFNPLGFWTSFNCLDLFLCFEAA